VGSVVGSLVAPVVGAVVGPVVGAVVGADVEAAVVGETDLGAEVAGGAVVGPGAALSFPDVSRTAANAAPPSRITAIATMPAIVHPEREPA
jgi:hypothetical protein